MKFCTLYDSNSWCVQNLVVIGRVYFKAEDLKFWSNFEFDRNIVSGTGARSALDTPLSMKEGFVPLTDMK